MENLYEVNRAWKCPAETTILLKANLPVVSINPTRSRLIFTQTNPSKNIGMMVLSLSVVDTVTAKRQLTAIGIKADDLAFGKIKGPAPGFKFNVGTLGQPSAKHRVVFIESTFL